MWTTRHGFWPHPWPGRRLITVYNVCDDDPAPPEDVLAYAAHLLGVPAPPAIAFDAAEMSDMARSFYSESKRVRNDRIRAELGVDLLYPTYREGAGCRLGEEPRRCLRQERRTGADVGSTAGMILSLGTHAITAS